MVVIEENLRIFGTKEGKSNKGGPNVGISTRSKNKKGVDVGSQRKKEGRPSLKNYREQERWKNHVDGT